jgi:hypothetical protein
MFVQLDTSDSSFTHTGSSSDYRGLKKMIAAIAEDVHRMECDEVGCRRPVLSDIQLQPDIPIEEVIFLSRPPSAVSPIASTHKRESHERHVSHQLPPQLVRDFLDLPDRVAESGRHKSRRSSVGVPRPTSLQTLSTAFWIGPTSPNRREYRFARCPTLGL